MTPTKQQHSVGGKQHRAAWPPIRLPDRHGVAGSGYAQFKKALRYRLEPKHAAPVPPVEVDKAKFGLDRGSVQETPAELEAVAEAVARSRRILNLKDNWDGEGSAGYAHTTWSRATGFVTENSLKLWLITGRTAPAPSISPAQDGSIDVLWKRGNRMLLLNFPEDADKPASYYGESAPSDTTNGSLPTAGDNHWLLLWLMR